MTLLEQLTIWQDELQELRHQLTVPPGLPSEVDNELVTCASAISSTREMVREHAKWPNPIPRAGLSERRIDLSVRSHVETDRAGIVRRTNNAAALLLNFPRHLLVGQPLLLFIKKEERRAFFTAFMELRHGAGTKRKEYLVMVQPVSMDPHLAILIAERVVDPAHNVLGITWLLAPA